MSELLTIDGLALPGRKEAVAVVVRPEVAATPRSAPRWLLPLTATALLHLGALAIIAVLVRLSPLPERAPEVLPIRLYAAGELAGTAASNESVQPRKTSFHSEPLISRSGKGGPAAPATAGAPVAVPEPVAVVMVAAPVTPVAPPVVVREAAFSAPMISEVADRSSSGSGAAALAAGESAYQQEPAFGGPTGGGVVGASGGKSMAAGGENPGLVPAQPLYRENPEPEYPPLARRRQQEGTVVIKALVTREGTVGELALHQSSGHRLLDEAALKGVKGWRFEPGRRGAAAVAMPVLVPVRFGLR